LLYCRRRRRRRRRRRPSRFRVFFSHLSSAFFKSKFPLSLSLSISFLYV
jgi:hypothetical protein